jgi:hypothetical protein
MTKIFTTFFALMVSSACSTGRAPSACDVLSPEDIARVLQTSNIKRADGSGLDSTTGIDSCRWTADGNASVELRIYRADSAAEGAWKMVFESARAHATRPDGPGRTLTGVGDDAMVLAGSAGAPGIAFRVGRTGAMIAGSGSEDAMIELAKRVASRL